MTDPRIASSAFGLRVLSCVLLVPRAFWAWCCCCGVFSCTWQRCVPPPRKFDISCSCPGNLSCDALPSHNTSKSLNSVVCSPLHALCPFPVHFDSHSVHSHAPFPCPIAGPFPPSNSHIPRVLRGVRGQQQQVCRTVSALAIPYRQARAQQRPTQAASTQQRQTKLAAT